ncbi:MULTISPECIES: TlpA family protein disulfide reductase [Sphingobacterium]|jgi:thiol-disulfide isomerase/thioredoxin|uniref:TlpA family protein disulfide reductase n=1 Tax=Sphingobacterium TaxID=28453 RepID=UPI00104ED4A3|nr:MULTISPECIES: TlpA disulfide reductase family protein [Sphingobacterium]MBB2951831.1 thiol-disulfide isomerase/thioredoxin [Sphingobacterium sp. JUb56]MCS3557041.1 thiol-disulfide isomerase/thioredoxin [Sphingobacterium sp. JUb21]MCW2260360.1 thiol-disulfide isomerase/thioredoxin [Sphingobacterium kitahiroshimense]QQD13608.1 TlpA family protein disulfide reductase [Sphingobacterium sp. UDSM-2020]TCQ98084.1 thiol-disulfide isomerase/thioredoxin [Sphingobacterium sp. JUb20]
MNPKTKKIIGNSVFVVIILLLLWPTSRAYFQQGLMKIGLFKPTLEEPEKIDSQISVQNNISFKNDKGEIVNMNDLKGKVVFINFWATWCPPCIAEMPSIATLYERLKGNSEVVFLIVEIEGESEKANKFMAGKQLNLPVYYPNSQIPKEWLGGSIPTTLIINKHGEIATKHEGLADYSRQEVSDFIIELTKK